MKLLELFSGTGSVGRAFASAGWDVTSLDSDPKTDATIHEDILTWDHTAYPPGHFDAIWASPDCTQYSCARRGAKTPRNLALADSLVRRSQEIIHYFNPPAWFIENPQTGLLKQQAIMSDIPYVDVDYCKYGMQYRKRTRLWNNIDEWIPRRLCKRDCDSMDATGKRHKEVAQRGSTQGQPNNRHKQAELYVVPFSLVREILVKLFIIDLAG